MDHEKRTDPNPLYTERQAAELLSISHRSLQRGGGGPRIFNAADQSAIVAATWMPGALKTAVSPSMTVPAISRRSAPSALQGAA